MAPPKRLEDADPHDPGAAWLRDVHKYENKYHPPVNENERGRQVLDDQTRGGYKPLFAYPLLDPNSPEVRALPLIPSRSSLDADTTEPPIPADAPFIYRLGRGIRSEIGALPGQIGDLAQRGAWELGQVGNNAIASVMGDPLPPQTPFPEAPTPRDARGPLGSGVRIATETAPTAVGPFGYQGPGSGSGVGAKLPPTPMLNPGQAPLASSALAESSSIRAVRMPDGKILFTNRPTSGMGGTEISRGQAGREIRQSDAATIARMPEENKVPSAMSELVRRSAEVEGARSAANPNYNPDEQWGAEGARGVAGFSGNVGTEETNSRIVDEQIAEREARKLGIMQIGQAQQEAALSPQQRIEMHAANDPNIVRAHAFHADEVSRVAEEQKKIAAAAKAIKDPLAAKAFTERATLDAQARIHEGLLEEYYGRKVY